MMLNWGLEVQSIDLTPEQSDAASALAQRLSARAPQPTDSAAMATDGQQERTDAAQPVPEKPRYDDLSLKNAKTIRKRTGATQKLAKALVRYLKALRDVLEEVCLPGHPTLEM